MFMVDPNTADSPESLAHINAALNEMAQTGQISEPIFFKGLVLLASRYAKIGDLGQALALVQIPTESYFQTTQVIQLEEDSAYQEQTLDLVGRFVKAGMVEEAEELAVTQKVAQA